MFGCYSITPKYVAEPIKIKFGRDINKYILRNLWVVGVGIFVLKQCERCRGWMLVNYKLYNRKV